MTPTTRQARERAAATPATPALIRTWTSPCTERISGAQPGPDGKRYAVQQNIWGNWYGYTGGKRVESFTGYDNCEAGAVAWLVARLTGGAK